eukprot:scaffold3039_cov117-Skeletonema_dohrnii-CCMP3373.AAC.12
MAKGRSIRTLAKKTTSKQITLYYRHSRSIESNGISLYQQSKKRQINQDSTTVDNYGLCRFFASTETTTQSTQKSSTQK